MTIMQIWAVILILWVEIADDRGKPEVESEPEYYEWERQK